MTLLFPRLSFSDERLAIRVDGTPAQVLSYRELAARAGGFAQHLAELGVARGDAVAVVSDTHIDTIVAMIGTVLAGAVLVPLNGKLGPKERAHILQDGAPKVRFAALAKRRTDDPELRPVPHMPGEAPRREVGGDPALMLYTSGTTGAPKGAVLRDTQIAANIDGLAHAWDWTDADTVAHALPLFHVHGLVLGVFGSLRVGGACRLIPRFSSEDVVGALSGEGRGTMFFAVPTMYKRLADAAESAPAVRQALAAARLLVSGSAGLPVREHRRIEALTGRGVFERYGLTETLINCAVPAHRGPMPGTVGFPLPGVELRLVADDGARIESPGVIGEVHVRGDSVFAGYHNRPDATAGAFDDDFFRTGDLATLDEDGALTIVGRRSVDLIKTGGYKVGAGEVEAAILEVQGVEEVAVVGVPDDDLGQRIEAFVVGQGLEAQALIEHVASQLTPHKRPRAVHFVASLPRNAMGKVQKKRLQPA